jgi:protein TonB
MSPNLRTALGLSAGLHAAVLAGWPAASPPQFDVERAPTSVELYLLKTDPSPTAEATPQAPIAPQPEPAVPEEVEPQPQTVVTPEIQGAQVERLPKYLRNAPPVYPRIARERGEEGTVLLEVEVLASGHGGAVNVLTSSGHAVLDEAAVRAVRGWVFRPARRWDQPVAFWVEIPITFRLVER